MWLSELRSLIKSELLWNSLYLLPAHQICMTWSQPPSKYLPHTEQVRIVQPRYLPGHLSDSSGPVTLDS